MEDLFCAAGDKVILKTLPRKDLSDKLTMLLVMHHSADHHSIWKLHEVTLFCSHYTAETAADPSVSLTGSSNSKPMSCTYDAHICRHNALMACQLCYRHVNSWQHHSDCSSDTLHGAYAYHGKLMRCGLKRRLG